MDDSVRPALTDRHFQRVEHQLGARRERMVMIEPRSTGMVLIMLRAADEVRAPRFNVADGAIDAEMLAIARTIIERRTGKFDPSNFRDRYQEHPCSPNTSTR
jgi:DNA end-binding protein Ku